MSPTGQSEVRGRLRLAYTPPVPPDPPSRVGLVLRAMFVRLRVLLLDLVALCGAVVALAPLLVRRRPIGRRAQVPRRAARVIPLPPRRRASPP